MSRRGLVVPGRALSVAVAILLLTQVSRTANGIEYLRSFSPEFQRKGDFDFSINIDINGQAFNVPVENARGRMVGMTDGQTIFNIQPRKGGRIWSSGAVTEFTTRINDEPVKIFFFPIRKITSSNVRLYTQAFVDNHRQVTEEFWRYTELTPSAVDDVTFIQKLDANTFDTDNVLGPRFYFDDPMVIYDRVVNGEHYLISVTDMGFDRFGPVKFSIPEPSSAVLLAVCALAAAAYYGGKFPPTFRPN